MISADIDSVPQVSTTVEGGIFECHVLEGGAFSERVVEWVKGNREIAVALVFLAVFALGVAVCCYKIVARQISRARRQAECRKLDNRYETSLGKLQKSKRNSDSIKKFIISLEKKNLNEDEKKLICDFVDAYTQYYVLRANYEISRTADAKGNFDKYRLETFHPLQSELLTQELLPKHLVICLAEGKEQG